jgi:HD-GYP domain-containing protein (c-di-GMP phosphodiesterase class II)
VRRLEFSAEATPEAIENFLLLLHQRLAGEHQQVALPRWPGIEAGDVSVVSEPFPVEAAAAPAEPGRAAIDLGEEVSAMRFVCERVATSEPLPVDEISGVLRSLTVALHSDGELLMPLLSDRSSSDQLAYHAVNTAVLAMSFSEWLGLGGNDARAVGRAALLHDIGMVRVPGEVFRVEALSDEGRSGVARHPEDGARFLLRQSPDLDLAATTAYEHHLRADGTGYPTRRYHKDPHYISRVVAVCGAYDALRSERCYRPARDAGAALREIEAGSGSAYDSAVAMSFVGMMRKWGGREIAATA